MSKSNIPSFSPNEDELLPSQHPLQDSNISQAARESDTATATQPQTQHHNEVKETHDKEEKEIEQSMK